LGQDPNDYEVGRASGVVDEEVGFRSEAINRDEVAGTNDVQGDEDYPSHNELGAPLQEVTFAVLP